MRSGGCNTQLMSTVIVLTKTLDKQVPLLTRVCCHWLKKSENISFKAVSSSITPLGLPGETPGPRGCKHQEGLGSVSRQSFKVFRSDTHNLHEEEKKRTIMDAYKFCQE